MVLDPSFAWLSWVVRHARGLSHKYKFRVLPYDFFFLSLSFIILPVLQLLEVFSFRVLLALSPTHGLHNTASLLLHVAPLPSAVTVTVCRLEALLAQSNTCEFNNTTSLSLHQAPLPPSVTVTFCHLEALLALCNTHAPQRVSSPCDSFVFLSPL